MKTENKNPGKDNLNQVNQDKNITNKPRNEQITNETRKEETEEKNTHFDPTKTPKQNNGKNDPGLKGEKEKGNEHPTIEAQYDEEENDRAESQEEEERRINEKEPTTKRNNPRP